MLKKTEFEMDNASDVGGGYEARLGDMLGSLGSMLRRRYLTLLIVSATIFAATIALIFLMSPKYDSIATIRLDPSRSPMTSTEAGVLSLNSEAIETEVGILNSLEMAQEVVRRLKLQADPEFNQGLDATPLSENDRLQAVALRVMKNLSVGREKLTYLLSVKFQSKDPVKSAQIANAFAQAYIETRVGLKMGAAETQTDWLSKQLAVLGREADIADAKVAQYRAQAGIVEGGVAGTVADQQIGPISSQLAEAESRAAAANASLGAARSQIASGGLDSVSEVRSSPFVSDLRRQQADVRRNLEDLRSRDGANHPEMIKTRDQLAQIEVQIREEAQRAMGTLSANAAAENARVGTLRTKLAQLKSEQASNTRASVAATSLDRDAVNKRAAYDKLAAMKLDSTQAAQNSIPAAVIADAAKPPQRPTSPNKPLLASMGLIVALALGLGTIVTQELLSSGLSTIQDVESRFGIPVVASIPAMKKSENPADDLLTSPATMFAEALRNARASVLGVRTSAPPRVIAITSALPSEGKTTTALAFARILAMNGTRTILIDCDVRKATLQSLVRERAPKGLVEVLKGTAQPSEAIVADQQPKLDLMMVNQPHFSGEDLFGGNMMTALVEKLRERYDFVILDLPPVMGVADSRFLAGMADAVTFVIKWNATPVTAVETSLGWLRSDNANVVGAIYTMVDPKSQAIGGFYYFQKTSGYYRN